MALRSKFAAQACSRSLLRQARAPIRTFTTRPAARYVLSSNTVATGKNDRYVRLFSSCPVRRDQSQTAPNAEAYIQSGVIKGAKNPVDVKKVLVIGSGGLSIGQAGEFDYSGWCYLHSDSMSHMGHILQSCHLARLGRFLRETQANVLLLQVPKL
jgi:carbamoyl-phosphate synthase large subunit